MNTLARFTVVGLAVLTLTACQSKTTTQPMTSSSTLSSSVTSSSLTADDAKALALKTAGLTEATVTNLTVRQETENGRAAYDIDFVSNGVEYSYTISANDGTILEQSTETADGTVASSVTADQAKSVALTDAGVSETAVTNLTVTQDTDNGKVVYEVDFDHQSIEYSYTIDATSSAILEKSQETVGD